VNQYKKVLFVGETGTCRSPMAAAIMKQMPKAAGVEIEACGMVSLFPEPINGKVEAVLAGNGIRVEGFESRQLESSDFEEETMIVAVDENVFKRILEKFEIRENVYLLEGLAGSIEPLINPYGKTLQDYGKCYEQMEPMIKKLVEQLEG
jgi:protein-tyrosine phosphatase